MLRRVGHAIFYLIMTACAVLMAITGVESALDAAEGQPVLWGTFTVTDGEPDRRGCRSVGVWLRDDGSLDKEQIYLDGSPDGDGTARASFQPSGRRSDEHNSIVHADTWSGAGIWMPWVGVGITTAVTIDYARRWRAGRP